MLFLKAVNQEFSYLESGLMSAGVTDGIHPLMEVRLMISCLLLTRFMKSLKTFYDFSQLCSQGYQK